MQGSCPILSWISKPFSRVSSQGKEFVDWELIWRGELIWRLSCYLKCVLTFNCLYHNIPDTLQRSMPFFLWLIYVCVAAMLSICLQQLRAFLPKKTTLPPMDYRRFLPPIYLDISFWWEIWFQQINISKQHLIKSRCGYFQTICF